MKQYKIRPDFIINYVIILVVNINYVIYIKCYLLIMLFLLLL